MTTGVYRIYDSKLRLLYVGISDTPLHRTQTHRCQSPWWPLADTWSVEYFPTRSEALANERHAARQEGPLYNSDYSELFKGSALDARDAIPEHLQREPVAWAVTRWHPTPKPYRIRYWDWGGRVENLSVDQARAVADAVMAANPTHMAVLEAEADGVPEPWGYHAVVGYAVRLELIGLADLSPEALNRVTRAEDRPGSHPPRPGWRLFECSTSRTGYGHPTPDGWRAWPARSTTLRWRGGITCSSPLPWAWACCRTRSSPRRG